MSTDCCRRAEYAFEQLGGMLLFRRFGRRKVYEAKCSHCGRTREFNEREATSALRKQHKEAWKWQ